MIVLHLILIVFFEPFSWQLDVNIAEKSRLRQPRNVDDSIYFVYEKPGASCPEGYYLQNQQQDLCRPICEKDCLHGKCTRPGTCSCNKGYELDPADHYTCIPICGTGKQRNLLDKQICEPAMCSKECINSLCRGREDCHCMVGFQKSPSNNYVCTPKCTEALCKNGKCTEEGECICNKGYVKDTQENCSPWCNRTCMNSTCTEPDVCTCHPGYRNITEHQCECPEQNYIIDGICKPLNICNLSCSDGRCSIDEKCFYCPERNSCFLIDNREKCLNTTLCLTNCNCSNEVCTCENTTIATTTPTTLGYPYFPKTSLPDIRMYGDFSPGPVTNVQMQNNISRTTIVSVGVTAIMVLGVAIAAGVIIRKRKRKSGGQSIQNDIYRTENAPEVNAIDIENEIYKETNDYEEIGEKMKSEKN